MPAGVIMAFPFWILGRCNVKSALPKDYWQHCRGISLEGENGEQSVRDKASKGKCSLPALLRC